jgi:hypothetical protein
MELPFWPHVTIFGFNTDIRHGDTVFHVQSEARENELTMQSAVFVRGRCIGKHTVSYATEPETPEFSEQHVHQLLTQQHRFVVNTIREGRLEALLSNEADASPAVATGVSQPAPAQPEPDTLTLEWLPDSLVWQAGNARMRFRVMLRSQAVEGARLITRVDCVGYDPRYAKGISDSRGEAELVYPIETGPASPASGCTVLVKVTAGPQSLTRKFRLQRD